MKREGKGWSAMFARILEWSFVDKGLLLLALLIPLFFQYILWSVYTLGREDRALLVDPFLLLSQMPLLWLFLGGAVGMLLAGLLLRRLNRPPSLFTHLCVYYFALTLVYCGYIVGSFHFVSGVVITGAPLLGLILFDRAIVYPAWGVALLVIIGSAYGGASGLLPYAPVFVPPVPGDPVNPLFWTNTTIFFAAPYLILMTISTDMLIAHGRQREHDFQLLSLTDTLTGAHNRRSAIALLKREILRMQRSRQPLSLVSIDLDHFKHINDTWGHMAGDRVLQEVTRELRACVRDYDVVGRWGGEEFIIILPETDLHTAQSVAERCRIRLASQTVTADNGDLVPVRGSFGVACITQSTGDGTDELIRAADKALYRAKQHGRNRVEAAPCREGTETV